MRSLALVALASTLSIALAACTTPEKASTSTHAGKNAVDCAGASLAVPDSDVVGTLDGKPIPYSALGKDIAAAEKKALYEYCDAVYAARSQALESYVTDQLVEKAAAASGKPAEEWMAGEMAKRIKEPTEEEVRKFFDEAVAGRPNPPPFEMVKDQVVQAMQREQSETAVRAIIGELRANAAFKASLPDVRSPPRDVDVPTHTATKGAKGAKVKVVEFADFECPYCSQAAASVKELEKKYGDKVEFAYRHFPLKSIHPNAQRAAEFSQCALAQGKFWQMHDAMYGIGDAPKSALDDESLKGSAQQAGLDVAALDACLSSGQGAADVTKDTDKAMELGVGGTPTFFINGRQHLGAASVEGLSAAIEDALH
jgi:protein-disulfide isomerase